jgi:hypothetical protein
MNKDEPRTSRSGRFNPWEKSPVTHWREGLVGFTVGRDAVERSISYRCRESNLGPQRQLDSTTEGNINGIQSRSHIPEDGILRSHRCENHKSYNIQNVYTYMNVQSSQPYASYCLYS